VGGRDSSIDSNASNTAHAAAAAVAAATGLDSGRGSSGSGAAGLSCVRYHPAPERLVTYAQNDTLYSYTLMRNEIQRKMTGVSSRHGTLRCAISPDGYYLVAGSEDGRAYFWDLASGRLEATLDVGFHLPLFDVCWHPTEHLVAFASFGADAPIVAFQWTPALSTTSATAMSTLGTTLSATVPSTPHGSRPNTAPVDNSSSLPLATAP